MAQTKHSKNIILGIVLLGYFMIILDNSIIFTGTVKIAQTTRLDAVQLSWIQNAYALTFGGFLLLGGRLGDIFGRKQVFQIGLVIFGIGSLLVEASINGVMMISARAFQGVGSAILASTTLALLMDNFQNEERTRAVAWYGSMAGVGASASQLIGGFFASALSWRAGFFINVPITLVMILLSRGYLSDNRRQTGMFDLWGSLTSLFGVASLIYAIDGAARPWTWVIAGTGFLIVFVIIEGRAAQPIMPLRLFTSGERVGAYLGRLAFVGAAMAFWFYTPQMLQNHLHYSALQAGIAFFPLTFVTFVFSVKVPDWTARWGNTKLLMVGTGITALGMLWLNQYQSGYWLQVALPMVVLGIGQGMAFAPLTAAGIAGTSQADAGAASGVVNVMHQMGAAFGISLVTAVVDPIVNPVTKFNVSIMTSTILIFIVVILFTLLILPATKRKSV